MTVCEPSCLFREYVEIIDINGYVYTCETKIFFNVLGDVDEAADRLPVTIKYNLA